MPSLYLFREVEQLALRLSRQFPITRWQQETLIDSDTIRLTLTINGRNHRFELTRSEIFMSASEEEALHRWSEFISRQLRQMLRVEISLLGVDWGSLSTGIVDTSWAEFEAEIRTRRWRGEHPYNNKHALANERAMKLFKEVAGEEAFRTILHKGYIPIQGNLTKTWYQLYNRAIYCVEARIDGRNHQFCAVVPHVPLWDHLLGIKLMIEHNEREFLRVANRSEV